MMKEGSDINVIISAFYNKTVTIVLVFFSEKNYQNYTAVSTLFNLIIYYDGIFDQTTKLKLFCISTNLTIWYTTLLY